MLLHEITTERWILFVYFLSALCTEILIYDNPILTFFFTLIFASLLFFHSLHFPSFQKYLLCASLDQIHTTPFLYPLTLPFSCLKSMQLILCPRNSFFLRLRFPFFFLNFPTFVHPLILTVFLFVPFAALLMTCIYTTKCFKPNQIFVAFDCKKNRECSDYVYFK